MEITNMLVYALLVDEIHPLLPMVNTGNLVFWVIAAMAVAESDLNFEIVKLGQCRVPHPLLSGVQFVRDSPLSVSAAVFILTAMINPYKGFISVTAAPLRSALEQLGRQ